MIHEPGIYFGMPEAEYHADESLSTSGIKKLIQDPEEFWDASSMNPAPPAREVKDHLARGTLWHCRILEPENFYNKYAAARHLMEGFDDEFETLETVSDMQAWMTRNNFAYKKSSKKDELAGLCAYYWKTYGAAACSTMPYLIDWEKAAFQAENPGKTLIWSREIWESMLAAEAAIKAHPYFSRVFEGGMSEVSIFWVDPESKIPMKCRVDKLKERVILDYKTMNVKRNKSAKDAALGAIKWEHYDIQTAVYTIGVAHAVNMINDGTGVIWGDVPGPFIDEFRRTPEKPFGFVFQKEDRPYTVRGLKVVRKGGDTFNVFGAGLFYMQQGIQLYQEYKARYGEARWVEPSGMEEIRDDEIYYS